MRWLLLINLLAVVLLSGAVAIVIEGTPVGTGLSTALQPALDDPNPQVEGVQEAVDAQEPMPASLDEAGTKNEEAAFNEPEIRKTEIEPIQAAPTQIENDSSLFAVPDAPIPLPAPRTMQTENVDVEIVAPDESLIAETGERQDKSDDPVPLVVATEGDFAPFNYMDEDGKPAGFDIDIAKALCRRLQRQCVFEVRSWADLMPALKRGDIDLIAASMRIPSTRPEGVAFTNPYYGSRGRFATAKGAGIAGPGLLRVAGSQIAVQRETIHDAYLRAEYPEVDLVRTKSLSDALQQVAEGKVEAAFGDNVAMLQWIKGQACCMTLGAPVADEAFFGEGIGLVVRAEDRDLLNALNEQLQAMLTDGTSAKLSDRYFGGSIY